MQFNSRVMYQRISCMYCQCVCKNSFWAKIYKYQVLTSKFFDSVKLEHVFYIIDIKNRVGLL